MLIDHIAVLMQEMGVSSFADEGSPLYVIMRLIGRLAFPIFAFLLVEGFYHTRSVTRYALRLAAAALVSEFFFDYLLFGETVQWYLLHQNVYVTLLLGLLMLQAVNWTARRFKDVELVQKLLTFVILAVFCVAAEVMRADYEFLGILMIAGFYYFRGRNTRNFLYFAVITLLLGGNETQYAAIAVIPFFCMYSGEKGREVGRLFYGFYPAHLALLSLIRFVFS